MLANESRPPECLSDLVLDQWRAGEIEDAARLAELEAHVVGCERCRARKDAFDRDAESYLSHHPVFLPREKARSQPKSSRSARRLQIFAGASALAAAAALALVLRAPQGGPFGGDESGTRIKGGSRVAFFVKRGDRVVAGGPGERLQPGDQLRFTATLERPKHLAIFSRDARGVASVYYPAGAVTKALPAGADVALETSVELDDALGEERVFAVFCDSAIAVEDLRTSLERTGDVQAGSGCTVDRSTFVKEPKP
jgi:hypothetical protein